MNIKLKRKCIFHFTLLCGLLLFKIANATRLPIIQPEPHIRLLIKYVQAKPGDSIRLTINNAVFSEKEAAHYWGVCDKAGGLVFDIPLKKRNGYFTLTKKRTFTGNGEMNLVYPLLWEAGDNIYMRISHKETAAGIYSTVNFSGRGSEKYVAQQTLLNTKVKGSKNPTAFSGNILENIPDTFSIGMSKKLEVLQQYKSKISVESYQVLLADLMAKLLNSHLTQSKQYYMDHIYTDTAKTKNLLTAKFHTVFFLVKKYGLPDSSLASSKDYLNYLYNLCVFTAFIKEDYSTGNVFKNIMVNFSGVLREKLLVKFFLSNGSSKDMETLYQSSVELIFDIDDKTTISKIFTDRSNNFLSDFIFTDLKGAKVRVSDFRNKILLMDFWFTGCGNCTEFYKAVLSKIERKYAKAKNFVMLSVSADKSQSMWKKSVQANLYTGESAINVYTNGLGFHHPMFLKFGIDSAPTVILVNKDGRISNFNTYELRDYNSLIKAIEQLK